MNYFREHRITTFFFKDTNNFLKQLQLKLKFTWLTKLVAVFILPANFDLVFDISHLVLVIV